METGFRKMYPAASLCIALAVEHIVSAVEHIVLAVEHIVLAVEHIVSASLYIQKFINTPRKPLLIIPFSRNRI